MYYLVCLNVTHFSRYLHMYVLLLDYSLKKVHLILIIMSIAKKITRKSSAKKTTLKVVQYIRVSTLDQNIDRQVKEGIKQYIDKCSGSIPFVERPYASKLFTDLKKNDVLLVHDIDRLGRNTIDVLQTIQKFNDLGVIVRVEKLGLDSLVKGKENSAFKIILSVMSTLAEMERNQLLERQKEGIEIAKVKGVYKGGKVGRSMDLDKWKEKNKDIITGLEQKISMRKIATMTNRSLSQVQKVKKKLEEI